MKSRAEALSLVELNVSNVNLVKHMLAAEAIMRALARHFGDDEDRWGLAGLLHDLDIEKSPPEEQGLHVPEMAPGYLDGESVKAVAAHNAMTGRTPDGRLGWSLYAADHLSGLITASALVLPEKRLANLTTQSVMKRFGEGRFARGANRQQIASISNTALGLEEFVGIGLLAMQGIAADLGL
jgi:uncharacterized protein